MSFEDTARLMQTYRTLEGERFQRAVHDAVLFIRRNEASEACVLQLLWNRLQEEYGHLQAMTIINDALAWISTRRL